MNRITKITGGFVTLIAAVAIGVAFFSGKPLLKMIRSSSDDYTININANITQNVTFKDGVGVVQTNQNHNNVNIRYYQVKKD